MAKENEVEKAKSTGIVIGLCIAGYLIGEFIKAMEFDKLQSKVSMEVSKLNSRISTLEYQVYSTAGVAVSQPPLQGGNWPDIGERFSRVTDKTFDDSEFVNEPPEEITIKD